MKTEKEIKRIIADCMAECKTTKFGNVRQQLEHYISALQWTLED